MTPVKTRVAFQGGGARLAELLPIVEALQRAQYAREIIVTHVSGTSAGSIAAALIATQTEAADFRTQLSKRRKTVFRDLLGRQRIAMTGVSRLRTFNTILRGRPISNKKRLQEMLYRLFQESNHRLRRDIDLQSLNIDGFSATVAHLTSCHGEHFSKSTHPTAALFDVIADSCAVPFLFKSLRDLKDDPADHHVDGGIVQNFPIDRLVEDGSQVTDMILGFGFADDLNERPVLNMMDYAGRLLSTSMNSSMEYAKRKVGVDRVFDIKSKLDAFDFEAGMNLALDNKEYTRRRDAAYDWITRRASMYRTSYERVTLSSLLERSRDIYRQYIDTEPGQDRFDLLRVIKIDSLFDVRQPTYSASDRSFTTYNVRFVDNKVNAIRIANPLDNVSYEFDDSLHAVAEPRIKLMEGAAPVEFTTMPARGVTSPKRLDHIVFFNGNGGGERVVAVTQQAYVHNGMSAAHPRRGGSDHLVMRNQGVDPIEGVTILFYIPRYISVDRKTVELSEHNVAVGVRKLDLAPNELAAPPGAQMSREEIENVALSVEENDELFFRLGWRIDCLPARSVFGLTLSIADIAGPTETETVGG